ncbi:hypothetical protein LUZ60_000856 [Juncus effusus]|nr:hypothetical protein LUZ60_000856 [Juncus effusus]
MRRLAMLRRWRYMIKQSSFGSRNSEASAMMRRISSTSFAMSCSVVRSKQKTQLETLIRVSGWRMRSLTRIKKIQILLDEISKDREALRITKEDGERRRSMVTVNPLPTSHLLDESCIFGRLNDKRGIINSLLCDTGGEGNGVDGNIIITPIVGMAGLGKTTLARMVYNDPLIQKNFDWRGWVYVSPNFDVLKVTKEIIESITGQPCGNFVGLSAAHEELIKLLKNHSLFLVLDDVWDVKRSHWETLLGPLNHAAGARIVITSRNECITRVLGIMEPQRLGYLPEEDCWLLFQHCAFGSQEIDLTSSLVEIGRKIVKNCGGLPLAVKSIGVLLNFEINEDRWRAILESELWKLDENDEIFPALKLSYHLLPQRLKPCFLYCSLFPKGSRLFKDHVVYMWMAHGYIQPCGNKRLEDVGSDYFNDLHMRSFFEILDGGWFKIHDMIHDLARSITTGEFFTVVHGEAYEVDERIHHLYLENINKVSVFNKHRSLRTLFSSSLGPILNSFNAYQHVSRLRALQLKDASEYELAFLFSNLKHLRYLGIGGDNIDNLPESVGLLYNLETLIIESCYRLRCLPITVGNLSNLRCFCVTKCKIEAIPDLICQIRCLQTLHLEACDNIIELPVGFGNLINLHILRIVSCSKINGLPNSIVKLINLQILDLRFTPIKRLPEFIGSLCNLQLLDLEGCWEIDLQNSFRGFTNRKTVIVHISIPVAFVARDPTMQAREIKWHHPTLMWLASLGGKLSISGDNAKITIRQANKFQTFYLESGVDIMSSDRSSKQLGALFKRKLYTQKYIRGMYTSSKKFLHSLRTYTKLIKLTIDGSYGIGYPVWSNPSFYEVTAVLLLKPYIEDGSFLHLVGQLPSLKVLILTGLFKTWSFRQRSFQYSYDQNIKSSKMFSSLEFLELQDMPELECWYGLLDQGFPKLRSVVVQNCPKLRRIPDFDMLQELEIRHCGLSELLFPLDDMSSELQKLSIEDCLSLTSVQGLQNLTALQSLRIIRCPKLEISPEEKFLNSQTFIAVMDCPKLKKWCERQKKCIQGYSSKSLRIPDVKHGFLNLSYLEHLCIENCVELSQEMLTNTKKWLSPTLISLQFLSCSFSGHLHLHSGLNKLRTLEIRGCLNLESVAGLHRLRFLSDLVLCDCPLLQISPEEFKEPSRSHEKYYSKKISSHEFERYEYRFPSPNLFPSLKGKLPPMLESLVIQGCHSFLSLHLDHCEPSQFIELEVINCRRLMHIEGLRNLTSLETLTIVQCPHLLLELLIRVPDGVVISGCPKLHSWCEMHCIEPLDQIIVVVSYSASS